LDAVDEVPKTIGTKGIWTLDRGGDRRKLFVPLLEKEVQFVIRMTSQRDMIDQGGTVRNIVKIAQSTRCPKRAELVIHFKGEALRRKTIKVGYQKVSFTFQENKHLALVVIKGLGKLLGVQRLTKLFL